MYTDFVSDEPLDIIQANECEAQPGLATNRFRRLWNEIERLRDELAAKEIELNYAAEAVLYWRNKVQSSDTPPTNKVGKMSDRDQELRVLMAFESLPELTREWVAAELRPAFDRLLAKGHIEPTQKFCLT